MRRLVILASLALGGCAARPAQPPHSLRVASINPCVDAVLAAVADPSTIAAVSHYSQDPRATSVSLAWARRFPATSGTAEELVALRPDVVLGGTGTDPSTAAALRHLGIPLIEYGVPETVADSVAQVRAIAAVVRRPARGEAAARAIERAAMPSTVRKVPALIWRDGGLVLGGGTLADALMTRAGFVNASARYGMGKWGVLPLEQLIAAPPRLLLSTVAGETGDGRAAMHPALRRLGTRIRIAPLPARLMNCGGPVIVPAMARLRAIRASVAA